MRLTVGKVNYKDFEIDENDFYSVKDEDIMYNNETHIILTIKDVFQSEEDQPIATLEATLYEAPIVFSPKNESGDYLDIPSMHELFDMHSAELGDLIFNLVKDDDNLDEYN